jgi:hypothetical protein
VSSQISTYWLLPSGAAAMELGHGIHERHLSLEGAALAPKATP